MGACVGASVGVWVGASVGAPVGAPVGTAVCDTLVGSETVVTTHEMVLGSAGRVPPAKTFS